MRPVRSSLRPRRPEHFGPRSFTLLTDQPAWSIVAFVLLVTIIVWQVAQLAGGAKSVVPHLFYLPIVLAAVRFGYRVAAATAVLSGVLAGPLLPLDISTGTAQHVGGWMTRLGIFLTIGLFVAWITSHTRRSLLTTGRHARLARELHGALGAGEVHVYYQPQVDLATGRPVGVEALVRWMHPTDGTRPAADFVPAAESTGLIRTLDATVLEQAVGQLAHWHRQGFDDLWVAVNISARWFHDPALMDAVTAALTEHGVAPHLLHVELTETAILANGAAIARQAAALRGLGVQMAIDDFGAGQTSLSHLHRFSIDTMKIDRGFTARIVDDDSVSRLVRGMIRLFDTMGVRVVVEGIETADQYLHARSLGAHIGQGYYIARPASAADVTEWLQQRRRRERARHPSSDGEQ